MKQFTKPLFFALAFAGLWLVDFSPEAPFAPVLVGDADAIVGRPLSPVSAAAANRLPAGTVVTALPSGCESTTVDGVSLFNCGGVMYQPSFKSNNLVYVVK